MILGFDFGGSKVDIGVGTSMGDLLDHRRLMVQDFPNARAVVGAAVDAGVELQRRYDVAAIGVSTMGITLADGVALAPNVLGWAELRLPSIFQHAFPNYPIAIDNDVRAAAVAQGMASSHDFPTTIWETNAPRNVSPAPTEFTTATGPGIQRRFP